MNKQTIEYYDWFDIQKEICKEMGIEEQYFRDYHKLVGGEYKDLWHEWMNYFESNVNNGVITENDAAYWEGPEHKIEWVKNDGKDWLEPFINAVYKVFKDNGIENIKYYW
jgi:hypothetical protein